MPLSLRPLLALRLAARSLARDPSTTLLAVGVLALGLALPATFFSFLVGAVRPLPVPDGVRVVRVDVLQPEREGRPLPVRPHELQELRGVAGLEALGGFRTFPATLSDPDRAATRLEAAALTPEVLPLLRVAPALGRLPAPGETDALLLGARAWRETYDADPGVLGRRVRVNGEPRTLVGILPEGFGFPFSEEAWVPVDPRAEAPLELVGRRAPGAGLEGVQAALDARWSGGEVFRDPDRTGGRIRVDGFTAGRGEGGEAVAFLGLVLVALCLLLIACANVANLLLVRAVRRVRALGIQSALGAGREQLALQLLTEALLVALVGGAAGLALAGGAVSAVERTLAAEHFGYFWMRLAVDGTVVAFVGVLVLGTAVVAGLLPVARILAADLQRVLKEEDAGVGGEGRWARGFVTFQLALSCGALVAAGLTSRGMAEAADFGGSLPGERILVASIDPGEGTLDPREMEEALAGIPGVRSVARSRGVPGYGEAAGRLALDGEEAVRDRDRERVIWNAVTPGYFETFSIPLRTGRLFREASGGDGHPVVVNEAFARRFSPGRDVLGRRIRVHAAGLGEEWRTVVGVVGDVELGGGEKARADRIYLPAASVGGPIWISLATEGPAEEVAGTLRATLAGLDAAVPVWRVQTLADLHAYVIRVPRTLAALAVAGGLSGLLVAAVGLFGLLSFRVRGRRRELGVRMALGADGGRLAREVVAEALRRLLPAVAVGLLLSWLASPVLTAMLVGVDPRGAGTYAAVAACFLGVGMAAALGPALRARSVEPARALRGG